MKVRATVVAVCVAAILVTSGCAPSSVTTTSYYNAQVGTTAAPTPDVTAVTEIAVGSGVEAGCFADGGAQPPSFPGWNQVGTSPSPGRCNFSGFGSSTWLYNFYSGECAAVGQPSDWQGYLTGSNVSQTVCTIPGYAAPLSDSHFAIASSLPSTVTMNATGLTTTYGMPQLMVFDTNLTLKTTVNAKSVAGNGSSATFPFPTSLTQGTYMFAVKNLAASSQYKVVDATYYSIGGNTTLSSAFGVDAADVTETIRVCYPGGGGGHGGCVTSGSTSSTPILTQYNSNQVLYITPNTSAGGVMPITVSVGTRPVAAKLYGSYTSNYYRDNGSDTISIGTTFPANAIVVNSGSNNVTLVNFANNSSVSIAVGTQPMAVAVNSAATMAYVANYGSGTLSEVNLSTQTVTRTATVGAGLLGVAMDPNGSYVWVGGTNYLYKVSLSTFTVVATQAVSGSVTSLAASNSQNELAYTLVQNCCTSSSTYAANELLLSNLSTPGTYAHAAASPYAPYTMNGTLPSAAVLPQATYVTAQFGNGMAASATPTGFVVYDVVSHQQLMTGTTPTPVRGIASDPLNTTVYFTAPDSNEYVIVPLPHL